MSFFLKFIPVCIGAFAVAVIVWGATVILVNLSTLLRIVGIDE